MLYQLSYDPLCAPQPTASDRMLDVHLAEQRLLKANEVRVYVVRRRSSNGKRPTGSRGRKPSGPASGNRAVLRAENGGRAGGQNRGAAADSGLKRWTA
ncbi:hypothetical protein GCM10009549_10700 [Streptomyces thermoalcalitolerans]|uniref:Uncharacterized protein n=1 Tax=Streptomyces thermoalcalitolerans TaxID=65605 RepID=A0ABN1NFX5_9ACTN